MKQFKCFISICCCMVLGGIAGCGLMDRSSPDESSSNVTQTQPVKGEVITEDENIVIRDKEAVAEAEPIGAEKVRAVAACTFEAAQAVAHLYLQSMPITDEHISLKISDDSSLTRYILENRALFDEDGDATKCIAALGKKITSLGEVTYRSSSAMNHAIMSRWGGASPEAAANAADTVQSQGVSIFQMGMEMQWLASVVPQIAAGHYDAFNKGDSPLRKRLHEIQMKNEAASAIENNMITPEMEAILNDTLNQYGPALDDQIITLAGTLTQESGELSNE